MPDSIARHLSVRSAQDDDANTIEQILRRAAAFNPYSDRNEHRIVEELYRADALIEPLIASHLGQDIGFVCFSPVAIADGSRGWYTLGPLAIEPGFENKGVAAVLVREGLERLKQQGAAGCLVVGDPVFYRKLGFRPEPLLKLANVPDQYFLQQTWQGETPGGGVCLHPAFMHPPA